MTVTRVVSVYDGGRSTSMARMKAKARKALPASTFALPGARKYPITDPAHAKSALGLAKMHGGPATQAAVRRKVAAKYPNLVKAAKNEKKRRARRPADRVLAVEDVRLGEDGARWKHGWIPLNPEAVKIAREYHLHPGSKTGSVSRVSYHKVTGPGGVEIGHVRTEHAARSYHYPVLKGQAGSAGTAVGEKLGYRTREDAAKALVKHHKKMAKG